jgi:drug/metabolite transporter (DMT)-like permease
MAFLRGPRLFGEAPVGAHAPANVPLGVSWMLLNTLLSAAVQIVNKRTLATFPTVSTTAAVAFFAVAFLIRKHTACACLLAPVADARSALATTAPRSQRRRWRPRRRRRGARTPGLWARVRTAGCS